MLTGAALPLSDLPPDLASLPAITARVHDRGGVLEARFLWRQAERLLPVRRDGRLQLLRWGCRRGEGRRLPLTGWARLATVEGGGWAYPDVEEAVVPASWGLAGGVWFPVEGGGVRCLVAPDERGLPTAYVVVGPSSHYFRVMTRSDWEPCPSAGG
jgi:hypothetical protein